MKTIFSTALFIFITANSLLGQTTAKYPFPHAVKYPYGIMTKVVTSDLVKTWYDTLKYHYLQTCHDYLRPGVDPLSKSLVEAQGFSMVAAAYMGDKETFDALYTFYKSKCTSQGCGMEGWKNSCDGFEDQGSATDGDVDVACALIVADWQWPGQGYDDKAKDVIKNLKKVLISCSGKNALAPGCAGGSPYGGCNETDISYYSPAFFRYFAKLSGDSAWKKLADDTHIIRDAAANSTTGLVPDWQSVSGTAGAGSRKGYYSFDAIRAPYKQTLDFIWNGNPKAEAWCKKISTWAYGIGPKNIKDEYQLNGSAQGNNHNMAAVGSLAVASMANTQEILDAFASEAIKLKNDYWYSGYLGPLYLLALSGNMWNPEIADNSITIHGGIRTGASNLNLKVKYTTNHELVVSGIPRNNMITLTTLSGRRIVSAKATTGTASVNIPGLHGGCCILTIYNQQGGKIDGRVVSLY